MIITTHNLLQYLLAKDLVSHQAVVDGDFAVIDVSGRNRNLKVLRQRGTSYFIKQIKNWDALTIAMLQCEAACYWLARNDPDFAALRPLTPEILYYDPERQILITKLITDAGDLWEHLQHHGKIKAAVMSGLGALLGQYHRDGSDSIKLSSQGSIFPKQIPWILANERRNSNPFKELSPATSELFDRVENSTHITDAINELRNDWNWATLMHGDLKLENCILARDNQQLTIIDWELADIGDPCWDIGSLLQSLISARVMSMPVADLPSSAEEVVRREDLAASLIAFWQSYALELRIDSSSKLLERCLGFAAARMIQSAYEYMQFSPQLSLSALQLLVLSEDLLKNTSTVAAVLLSDGRTVN